MFLHSKQISYWLAKWILPLFQSISQFYLFISMPIFSVVLMRAGWRCTSVCGGEMRWTQLGECNL